MIGKTLGHYRIGEQLGRGGMGEVYLADDLNLNRKVALKFLPDAFTGDPERMARFEREAKLLASLNHPNIAAIYGLEQAEGKRFIVMELVEGETLAQRIAGKGALPVDEALAICRQIADALETAHEKGVIHRDLKPANVMISEGDKVKILDFGLAKALSGELQSVSASQSPTITEAMTQPGVILGTAAYISPEQAKGKSVDKRADIWAFGCILYECLTGKRVFEGETVTETMAAVLTRDPEWEKVPARVHHLLQRCLEKDPKKRLRDIGEAMAWVESVPESAPARRPWLWISVAATFIVAFVALSFIHFREKPLESLAPIRFQIPLPDKVRTPVTGAFAVSPDGSHLAFTATGSDGIPRLWVRALDSLEAYQLPGTESNLAGGHPPFCWSPDSRFIAFDAGGKIKKVDILSGQPLPLCDLPSSRTALGISWNQEGVIIFGLWNNILMRVSASGGTASPLSQLNVAHQIWGHHVPTFLPDGRHFLFHCNALAPENRGVYVGSLDTKPEEQGSKHIPINNWFGYAPSPQPGPGYLLFLQDQTLMARQFDEKRLELIGEAMPVVKHVGSYGSYPFFSVSTNGTLVYRSGSAIQFSRVQWYDRQGNPHETMEDSGNYGGLTFSPDGAQLAFSKWDTESRAGSDIYLRDRRGINTPLTHGKGDNKDPVWSPDGKRIIFSSIRHGGVADLYEKPTNGIGEETLLLPSKENKFPSSLSRDGRLLYTVEDAKTGGDVWILPMEGERRPISLLHSECNEIDGRFSPDMQWIAYTSDESGSNEIWVTQLVQASEGGSFEIGDKHRISKGGGIGARWGKDGKEIYYRAPDGKVIAVPFTAGAKFQPGMPVALFQVPLETTNQVFRPSWDVTADGTQFVLPVMNAEGTSTPFTVILNWTSLLKK
jgi:eukaryotic-like serine/threonine-protein kinase